MSTIVCRLAGAAFFTSVLLSTTSAHAAAGYDADARVFRLDGGDVTYAFGISPQGYLQAVYWGGRLADSDKLGPLVQLRDHSSVDMSASITPQEFPGQGGGIFAEPALKVAWPDGSRDVVLKYASHTIARDRIDVVLEDIGRPLRVTLCYTIDPDTGIVGRSATIENRDKQTVRLDQVQSASYTLPTGSDYQLHYLTGRWAAEWTLQQRPVTEGSTVIESRRGSTGHQANPWFAIDRARDAQEESGAVWFGALAWSGSWRMTVDRDQIGKVRVVGGYNPFDFAYNLKSGERLETPVFYAGYSAQGMGGASRLMHRFQRDEILPRHDGALKLRPVLYNSWEATEFKVDEAGQMALAEKAASLGVERFVMDDGWFGKRNSDKAGLGDWTPNPEKFPNGLKPLIDKVQGLGMEFGLWVEPEMVNPDSDLYRAHPDWVINFPGRPRSEGRNQLMLNLARRDVRDHVFKVLDDLVSKNEIKFLKWDYNRNWSEPGWPEAGEDQQRIYVDYVENLYWIIAELRRRHPGLEIETCSGGGGRVDLGILGLTDQAWPSDNTDPYDRLTIQDGFSHAYAPAVMMDWVTDSPNWVNRRQTSLEYRFLSAMQGGLGIGANLNHWQDSDFATAKQMVAEYKAIRATVQQGDLYRLISPQGDSQRSATLSVSPDRRQAVLFAFLHSSTKLDPLPAIQLRGLDPAKIYRLRRIGAAPQPGEAPANPPTASGRFWMERGILTDLRGDFQAAGFVLEAAK